MLHSECLIPKQACSFPIKRVGQTESGMEIEQIFRLETAGIGIYYMVRNIYYIGIVSTAGVRADIWIRAWNVRSVLHYCGNKFSRRAATSKR